MQQLKKLIYLTFLLGLSTSLFAEEASHRVLMVLSSHGVDAGKTQPGFEFDEFAKAYLVFNANNIEVDIASPKGGIIEADEYDRDTDFNQQVLNDKALMKKLNNSLPLKKVQAKNYNAIFIVGGKGAMFDLPNNYYLQNIITTIYENKGIVSAVCHGPAALVNVKLADGSYLVNNRNVNAFTNDEENAFSKKWSKHYDFMLEDRLKKRGAIFQSSPMLLGHVSEDGQLITGQNPFSTGITATAVVHSMGIRHVKTLEFKDEATMKIVKRVLAGDNSAAIEFSTYPERFQATLLGMYGYYHAKLATNESTINEAITLMEMALKFTQHAKLSFALANSLEKIGQRQKAINTLELLLGQHPEMEQAKQLLTKLKS